MVIRADGTFAKSGQSFAWGTTANLGRAFRVGADVGVGQKRKNYTEGKWRLDGLQLTTVENGRRRVQLVYVLPHFVKAGAPAQIMLQGVRWSRPKK